MTGLVNNPMTLDLDDLTSATQGRAHPPAALCRGVVHGHPVGRLPISALLKDADPTSAAQYVSFVTVLRPDEMRPALVDPGVVLPGRAAPG